MNVFHNSNEWIQKADNFTQRDVDEAKLNVFKAVDKPILPGNTFYHDFTVWKFQDASIIQILCEMNLWDSGTSKIAILYIFTSSDFFYFCNFQSSEYAKFHENQK